MFLERHGVGRSIDQRTRAELRCQRRPREDRIVRRAKAQGRRGPDRAADEDVQFGIGIERERQWMTPHNVAADGQRSPTMRNDAVHFDIGVGAECPSERGLRQITRACTFSACGRR